MTLLQRIESMNMADKIFDVIVPKEMQIVDKKETKNENDLFGLCTGRHDRDDESWYVVQKHPNVQDS